MTMIKRTKFFQNTDSESQDSWSWDSGSWDSESEESEPACPAPELCIRHAGGIRHQQQKSGPPASGGARFFYTFSVCHSSFCAVRSGSSAGSTAQLDHPHSRINRAAGSPSQPDQPHSWMIASAKIFTLFTSTLMSTNSSSPCIRLSTPSTSQPNATPLFRPWT